MLNGRCLDILKLIINSNAPVTIKDIAERHKISSRSIRYDLNRIDEFLKENNLKQLNRKPNEGISIELKEEDINKLLSLTEETDNYDYVMSQNERITYIICKLLEKESYVTANSIAEDIFVSRGTINNDLKEVKKLFVNNNIKLESTKSKGIKAIGDERKIRKVASSLMSNNTDATDLIDKNFKKLFGDMDLDYISKVIKIAEDQLENTLSDYSFNSLLIHIAIAIKRIELEKDIVMDERELDNLVKMPEFAIASSMAKMLEERYCIKIPKSEIGYITIHLLGSNVMLKEENNNDFIYTQLIATTLLNEIEKRTKYNFNKDKQLLDGLVYHIRPMIYRLKHGISINNPLLHEIINKYNEIFTYVEESLIFLKKDLHVEISREEIGYITLHFMASIERIKNCSKTRPRVLVVCATGAGTSKFVSVKLKSIFDIDIVDTISSHDVTRIIKKESIDLIITTIPIKVEGIRCILVSPFLTEKNISELILFFSRYSNTKSNFANKEDCDCSSIENDELYNINLESKRSVIENILKIVDKNCSITNHLKLEKEIALYFTTCSEDLRPALNEVLNPNFIKMDVEVEDWKDAIRKGGQILKENGCINESYINAMIDNVKRLGSYIVVLPGIAMPHAMPKEGALKIGFSIIILKNSIIFGNIENDPVKVIITMSAIDNRTHMNALKEMMKIIEQDNFINKVSKAKTIEEVLGIFN